MIISLVFNGPIGNRQCATTGSDNDLVPSDITWTKGDSNHCRHMALLDHIELIHWGRVTHICMYMYVNYTIICSDTGLLPIRRQAFACINHGI